jgi:crotonobetainyl-CoA:carnitine CoA-transferase CaiB-like acyl-CoA transferase
MFDGIRILDLGEEPAFLAGKILAELGADVIKVEPPGGDRRGRRGPWLGDVEDPERSLSWLALNTSKRGITLDLARPRGRELLRDLAVGADVVLESFAPGVMKDWGLGFEALHAHNPRLVYCALTPFGQTGPYAHYRAGDLAVVAMGGNAGMTGDPDRPPVRCTMPTAWFHAGPEAALGIAMALWAREENGRGQFVDVSMQECQLATLVTGPGQYARSKRLRRRSGAVLGNTREIWKASDGYVTFGLRGGPARIPNLIATVEYMAEEGMAPEWLRKFDWESYNHNTLAPEEIEKLERAFGAFFATKTRRELYEQALVRRMMLAPCNDAREISEQPQLRYRELFTSVECRVSGARCFVRAPRFLREVEHLPHRDPSTRTAGGRAQRRGVWRAGARSRRARSPAQRGGGLAVPVFAGLKILELGAGAAGPVATRYFADQGATVVRVESSKRPDFLRLLHLTKDNPFGLDGAPMFVLMNPNKKSVSVNMSTPEGIEVVRKLVDWADVVSENFSPKAMTKWGLDYESLRRRKHDLVMVSSCLFGQTGPQRMYPGFGGQGSALSGFNHMAGWPDREAVGPHGTITDSLSPRYVALLIVAALLHRRRTGHGQYIDVSQIETGVYSLSEMLVRYSARGEVMERRGNADERAAPHGIYPCRGEDRWIALAVGSDAEWKRLCGALGGPACARDPRFASAAGRREHREALDAAIAEATRGFDPHALMQQLQEAGVEAGAVQDFEDLLNDPQLAHRGHFQTLHHVHLGEMLFENYGIRLSESAPELRTPGANLGEHNHEVLQEVLGCSAEEIDSMVENDILV